MRILKYLSSGTKISNCFRISERHCTLGPPSIPSPTKLSDGAQSSRVSKAWSESDEDLSKVRRGMKWFRAATGFLNSNPGLFLTLVSGVLYRVYVMRATCMTSKHPKTRHCLKGPHPQSHRRLYQKILAHCHLKSYAQCRQCWFQSRKRLFESRLCPRTRDQSQCTR
jgi:hypothetical protein